MKLTLSQRLMVDDGAPSICFLTAAQRVVWWKAHPPAAMPAFQLEVRSDDEATQEFRRQEAERRRLKSLAGIARMKNRIAHKKIDLTKMRWDPRRNKFVEDNVPKIDHDRDRGVVHTPPHPKEKVSFGGGRQQSKSFVAMVETMKREADNDVGKQILIWVANFPGGPGVAYRALAELNGVWDDKYAKLSGGLLVMAVTNRLKGLVKKGGAVKWS